MNNRLLGLIIILSFQLNSMLAQRFEILKNEVIELGARSLEDSARAYIHVALPKNTKGFAYRFSLYRPDKVKIKDSLTVKMLEFAPEEVILNDTLEEMIARQTNTEVIDFYIVPTMEDAKGFKERKMFNSCLRLPNALNFAGTTDTCVGGEQVAFCFRNMNPKKNIKVHFELVAIVNEDHPRWTAERRKEMIDLFQKKVGDICYLLTEEEKEPFAKALSTKFMSRYSDAQTKVMSQLEMQEATELCIKSSEKLLQVRCMPSKKSDKNVKKKKEKKKKETKKKEPKKEKKKEEEKGKEVEIQDK
jgi:hypothetical protein